MCGSYGDPTLRQAAAGAGAGRAHCWPALSGLSTPAPGYSPLLLDTFPGYTRKSVQSTSKMTR
jgi:hypothetical protein